MKVQRCKKCGCFYTTNTKFCSSCNIKMGRINHTMEEYLENNGIDLENIKSKEELFGVFSLGLGEFSKRDILLGIENMNILDNLNNKENL